MEFDITDSWKLHLREEFQKPYFKTLTNFIHAEYDAGLCYPPKHQIFSALNHCSFEEIKVIIIGQDPYHGPNQANGLCFSVQDGIPHPPSLKNIFKEIENDIGKPPPLSGNLAHWSTQGVLLLNATLTVRAHEAGSHQKRGWEKFTNAIIQKLSNEREHLVFLLWGGYAKKKLQLIDTNKHQVLVSGHPSPLSANRGYWYGNKHFSQTNKVLFAAGKTKIKW